MIVMLGFVCGAVVGGEVWFRLRAANEYVRGISAGRDSTRMEHGWHPLVFDVCNAAEVPGPRRRSPDEQLVRRRFMRAMPPTVPEQRPL